MAIIPLEYICEDHKTSLNRKMHRKALKWSFILIENYFW